MGSNSLLKKKMVLLRSLHLFLVTAISLQIPTSFLIIARLTTARYMILSSSSSSAFDSSASSLSYFFFYTNPNLICALVSVVSLDALIHVATDWFDFNSLRGGEREGYRAIRPRVREAWFLLGALQVCVGLGSGTAIKAGVKGQVSGEGGSTLLTGVVFFVGLYEIVTCWSRTVVRPVVDRVVLCGARRENESRAERWAVGASLGALWGWKLRHEVEALVDAVLIRRERKVRVELGDVLGWWLYYFTVIVGAARIVKVVIWLLLVIFFRISPQDEGIGIDDDWEDEAV